MIYTFNEIRELLIREYVLRLDVTEPNEHQREIFRQRWMASIDSNATFLCNNQHKGSVHDYLSCIKSKHRFYSYGEKVNWSRDGF